MVELLKSLRFESQKARTLVGLNCEYTFESAQKIPEQWARFAPSLGKIEGQVGVDSYGVIWNEKPGSGFDYFVGVELKSGTPVEKGLQSLALPEENYAVFVHDGSVATIPHSFNRIFSEWLPGSGFVSSRSPANERYTKDYDPKTQSGGIEFWVPVKKISGN